MLKRRLKIFSFILFLALLSLLAGCETKQEVRKNPGVQHLNLALQSINSLDPARLASSGDFTLAGAVFEGLVRSNPDGTLGKALAKDWLVENDGARYTFYLRDAWWSNGEKITARDFEYAWKRALDPATASPYPYLLFDIKYAENYNRSEDPQYQGKKVQQDLIAIKALNDNTLVVDLKEANTAFLKKLTHPVFYPLPSTVMENAGDNFTNTENILSNGPFKIVEYNNEYVMLSKNENYWDQQGVRLSTIKGLFLEEEQGWELFNKGDLDLILNIPQKVIKKGISEGKIKTVFLLASYYYDLNTGRSPLDDKRIRQALSYAIDRNYLIDNILQGGQNAARGIMPANDAVNSNDSISFNPEAAKKLVTEAGYASGEDLPVLEMLIREGEGHEYIASALKDQWKNNLGIEVKITSLKWEDMNKRLKDRNFDVALQGLSADYNDYLAFLDRFALGSGNNYTGWTSLKLNEEIRRLKLDHEEDFRKTSFMNAEKLILEDLPVLPIYDYTRAYALKSWVNGLYFPPAGLTVDFKWAYME